jgi:hypothetical protein
MLMKNAVSQSHLESLSFPDAPEQASVTYVKDSKTVWVPVYPILSSIPGTNFAPPFVLPPGQWTVQFIVQQPGSQTFVFDSVTFDNPLANVTIENPDQAGGRTWSATLTNTVPFVNMLSCTINLVQPNDTARMLFSGDPTIAVVPDPM